MVNIDSENRPQDSGWRQTSIALPSIDELSSIIDGIDYNWLSPVDRNLLTTIEGFARTQGRAMIADASAIGLGDKFIFLRHVAGFARHFPDRKFFVQPALIPPLNALSMPPNVVVEASEPEGAQKILFNDLTKPFIKENGLYRSTRDAAMMCHLARVTGLDVQLYDEPIVGIDQRRLQANPITHDVIIFPDALEVPEYCQGYRKSQKSIAVSKWKEIFKCMGKDLDIAIVRGVAHPEYCDYVLEIARWTGHHANMVEGNLDHVTDAILSARRFVGMDSGTTHLAAQVIRAAQKEGRNIAFRQFFAPIFPLELYGISGSELRTFYYKDEGTSIEDMSVSMSDVDPRVAADFIMS